MKNIIRVIVFIGVLYAGTYISLRYLDFLVRQEFITFGASDEIANRYKSTNPNSDFRFESDRVQIGVGRIQKQDSGAFDSSLEILFYPLCELEMVVRGYIFAEMRVLVVTEEPDHYDPERGTFSSFERVMFHESFTVSRYEQ